MCSPRNSWQMWSVGKCQLSPRPTKNRSNGLRKKQNQRRAKLKIDHSWSKWNRDYHSETVRTNTRIEMHSMRGSDLNKCPGGGLCASTDDSQLEQTASWQKRQHLYQSMPIRTCSHYPPRTTFLNPTISLRSPFHSTSKSCNFEG